MEPGDHHDHRSTMTVDDGNAAGGSAGREPDTDESRETDGRSVGNLELFFDLTFVYAMSQVTRLMLNDISWQGFGRGVLALLALWWAWVCYAWLTNMFEIARVIHTILIILAMAAMLIAVIALPTAFTTGALVFGLALLAVRLINAGMFIASSSRDEAELASAIRRLAPGLLVGPALIVASAFVASPYRELLWVAAAAVDFGSPLIAGTNGLRVVPSYFIQRHGSVIIIALGEAIIALGAGASEDLRHPGVLAAVVLGVLISASLWWTYFGLTAGAEETYAANICCRSATVGARRLQLPARAARRGDCLLRRRGTGFGGTHRRAAGAAGRPRPHRWGGTVLRRRGGLPMA
jgi:low temperature requirement protein LtrA